MAQERLALLGDGEILVDKRRCSYLDVFKLGDRFNMAYGVLGMMLLVVSLSDAYNDLKLWTKR